MKQKCVEKKGPKIHPQKNQENKSFIPERFSTSDCHVMRFLIQSFTFSHRKQQTRPQSKNHSCVKWNLDLFSHPSWRTYFLTSRHGACLGITLLKTLEWWNETPCLWFCHVFDTHIESEAHKSECCFFFFFWAWCDVWSAVGIVTPSLLWNTGENWLLPIYETLHHTDTALTARLPFGTLDHTTTKPTPLLFEIILVISICTSRV